MRAILRLSEIYNYYNTDFKSFNGLYWLFCLQYLQLASVVSVCVPSYLKGDDILQQFIQLISYTSPMSWESIATTQAALVLVGSVLGFSFLLKSAVLSMIFERRKGLNEFQKFILMLSKLWNVFFEYILLIPILTWMLFDQLPLIFSVSDSNYLPIKKSPRWFLILAIIMLTINCSFDLLLKLVDVPFRNLFRDKLKTATFFYDFIHIFGLLAIILLASKAQIMQIRYIWPNVASVAFGIIIILMEFIGLGHRNPSSRRFNVYVVGAYLFHTVFLLVIGNLEENFGKLYLRYFAVIYFISLPFILKACIMANRLFLSSDFSRICWFKVISRSKKFEEMMNIMSEMQQTLSFPSIAPPKASLKALFRQTSFISDHTSSCKIHDCFCSRIQRTRISSNETDDDATTAQLPPIKIIESYYQQLLKICAEENKYEFWALVTYVLFQAVDLQKPIKAGLLLQRFRSPNLSIYERYILNSLILFLQETHKKRLGNLDQGLLSVSLLDGLSFDTEFQEAVQEFTKIQKVRSEFFKYLVESNPIDSNKLYHDGKIFIDSANKLENKIEELYNRNSNSLDTISLLVQYRLSVIGGSKTSLRHLINKLNNLRTQNMLKKDEAWGQDQASSFDYLDSKNIFLAFDIVKNLGELISYSSNLCTHLRYTEFQTKLTLTKILPDEIGNQIIVMLQNYLAKPTILEETTKFIEFLFLSDRENYLLPYSGYFKVEFMLERVVCASAALKKLNTSSQFLLTKPSGEIIATTKKINTLLRIESNLNILGTNICLVVPSLLEYYIDNPEKREELYPNLNICSIKIAALAYLERQHILDAKNPRNSLETREILLMLNDLNTLTDGQTLDHSKVALIEEKLGKMQANLNTQHGRVHELTIKVRKWCINDKRYKILEISNCNSDLRQPTKFLTKNGRQHHFTGSISQHNPELFPNEEAISNISGVNDELQIPEEGARFIKFSNDFNSSDMIIERKPRAEPEKQTINFSKTNNSINLESHCKPFPETATRTVSSNTRQAPHENFLSFQPQKSVELIQIPSQLQREPEIPKILQSKKILLEENSEIKQQVVDLVSEQKNGGSDHDDDNDESLRFGLQKSSISEKFENRALNSQATPTEDTKQSFKIREVIQNNPVYRVVKVNFFVGLLGVAVIVSLFTAQYIGYKDRMNEATFLIRSITYPMEIATHEELQFKEFRKWEFYTSGLIPYSVDFWNVAQIISLAYQNIVISYTQLIMNPQNVSQSVNTFLSDPSNQIEMKFLDNDRENMSLILALMTHSQAFEINYNYDELDGGYIESTARNDYILEEDANSIYDTLVEMNVYLNEQIQNKIQLVQSFNITLLVVVAAVIFGIDICCIIMYQNIHSKRKKMLSLFCTVSRTELSEEYERITELLLASTTRTKPRQQLLTKKDHLTKRKLYSGFTYRNPKKWNSIAGFTLILSLFLVPFIAVFIQTVQQLDELSACVDQIDTWVGYEAALAGLYFQNYHYYSNINSTDEVKASINSLKLERLQNFENQIPEMQNLIFTFGNLTNQAAYDAASTTQIYGGIVDICTYNNHPDPRYNIACRRAANGIANSGILQTADYFLDTIETIYNKILNSSNQSQALNQLCQDIVFTDSDTVGIALNRYLRITSDMMIYSIVNYITTFNDQAFRNFLGIVLAILLVLGVGWVAWIRKMQNSLNETKNIFRILTSHMLQHTPTISNYFKQELQQKNWCF